MPGFSASELYILVAAATCDSTQSQAPTSQCLQRGEDRTFAAQEQPATKQAPNKASVLDTRTRLGAVGQIPQVIVGSGQKQTSREWPTAIGPDYTPLFDMRSHQAERI